MSGLVDRIATAAMPGRRRWASWTLAEPVLAGLGYRELLAVLHDQAPPVDYAHKDSLLAALVRLSGRDQQAGVVLMACLTPGVKARLRLHRGGVAFAEAEAAMIAALWRRIVSYPLERRPASIAANLLGDTLHDFIEWRDRERAWADHTSPSNDDPLADDRAVDPNETLTPALLWHDAHRAQVLSVAESTLIDVTRLVGVPLPVVAGHLDISHAAARKRRRRAELRWAPWWTNEGVA